MQAGVSWFRRLHRATFRRGAACGGPVLDIRLLREDPERVRADLKKRERDPGAVDEVLAADQRWRDVVGELNDMRALRNATAKKVALAKKKGEDAASVIAEMKEVGRRLENLEAAAREEEAARDGLLMRLPNLMHPDVPVGPDESGNVTLRTWGEAAKHAFEAKSHVDLLSELGVADLERAARASGARFVYLKGGLALLHQALLRFATERLVEEEFTPVVPPFLLRRSAVEGATDLADFEDVIYKVEGEDLYLAATSEHALGAMHMGEIVEAPDLPLRYAGISPCFRKEAGAHGKDTRGIFRLHQFEKIEQFVFMDPEPSEGSPGEGVSSWDVHEELIANAESLYQALEIPYRVVDICTGDLGTVAARKYDIEAWMPVQGTYREVVSCSNCTDYQARRWNIRTRDAPGQPTRFVHTLNSTMVAVERTLVALLENHQQADGSVVVPKALRPYALGLERLEPLEQ
jgi:seryl-tRNA synthetase